MLLIFLERLPSWMLMFAVISTKEWSGYSKVKHSMQISLFDNVAKSIYSVNINILN